MGWGDFYQHIVTHPYPDPILLGGVLVGMAFGIYDYLRGAQ